MEDRMIVIEKAINQIVKEHEEMKGWIFRVLDVKRVLTHRNNLKLNKIRQYYKIIAKHVQYLEADLKDNWEIQKLKELLKKFKSDLDELNFY